MDKYNYHIHFKDGKYIEFGPAYPVVDDGDMILLRNTANIFFATVCISKITIESISSVKCSDVFDGFSFFTSSDRRDEVLNAFDSSSS